LHNQEKLFFIHQKLSSQKPEIVGATLGKLVFVGVIWDILLQCCSVWCDSFLLSNVAMFVSLMLWA